MVDFRPYPGNDPRAGKKAREHERPQGPAPVFQRNAIRQQQRVEHLCRKPEQGNDPLGSPGLNLAEQVDAQVEQAQPDEDRPR
ncbi:hypothetical protein D3C80_2061630 [compost metagenome]